MEIFNYIPPSDKEIEKAQKKLGFVFPADYIEFIKSGYDLGNSTLEALEINNPISHVDIYETIENARKYYGLPINLLPIVENNADYYCLNERGEIIFWSHNGATDEKWRNISDWKTRMIAEANE